MQGPFSRPLAVLAHAYPDSRLASIAVLLLLAGAGCSDQPSAPVRIPHSATAAALAIRCTADVHARTLGCESADSTRGTSPARAVGAARDLMVGGKNVYITLTSSNVAYSGEVFSFDVTVKNLIPQALGTTDGSTLDPNGVRVFFSGNPVTTAGTGSVDFVNPVDGTSLVDGFALFTASNQAYYQYSALLAQNQTSPSKHWRLHAPATVSTFTFTVFVDAAVQFPNGWIDLSPAHDSVPLHSTAVLYPVVRSAVGNSVSGHTLTWSSSAPAVATVNSSTGVITPVSSGGTTTITVTDGTLSASVPVVTVDSTADEPVFNAGTNTVVFQDNMDEYTDIVSMGTTPQGTTPRIVPNPSPVEVSLPVDTTRNKLISPGRGGTGHAIRLLYDGTEQFSAKFETLNQPATANMTTHYFQYWARVNVASAITAGTTFAVKWFEAWHNSQSDRVQWNTHDHLPCTLQNTSDTYWQLTDYSTTTTCQGNQPSGPYFPDIANNQWHRFTFSYRPNSSAGARDGFARMWIDGTRVIDVSGRTIGITPPGGYKPWCLKDDVDAIRVNDGVGLLKWGSTQTSPTPAWTLDIDDFLWWR